jgi:hypothetical protein
VTVEAAGFKKKVLENVQALIGKPTTADVTLDVGAVNEVVEVRTSDQEALVNDFRTSHPNATDEQTRDFLINNLSPRYERAVGDFHRIGEPTKDKAGWDHVVTNLDDDLVTFKSQISDAPAKLVDSKPFAAESKAFTDYGFKECGKALG